KKTPAILNVGASITSNNGKSVIDSPKKLIIQIMARYKKKTRIHITVKVTKNDIFKTELRLIFFIS
ncbi:MAG: hypothetical protein KAX28_11005, partial [Candidatus Marinimicrobia bacterium]|nr:hypothetical protein [Candidatus Neomarinimicrobiota bacterium]